MSRELESGTTLLNACRFGLSTIGSRFTNQLPGTPSLHMVVIFHSAFARFHDDDDEEEEIISEMAEIKVQ